MEESSTRWVLPAESSSSMVTTVTFGVNVVTCHLQIGTYQMAVCSKAHNKPFYVVAESFKFVRLYPLNQQDVPDRFKVRSQASLMSTRHIKNKEWSSLQTGEK